MTKIKLNNGTILDAETIELKDSILLIKINSYSIEELAELFSNEDNTKIITLMTESELESGFQYDFTHFIGIHYGSDGTKTVQLSQPYTDVESRLINTEIAINALFGLEE